MSRRPAVAALPLVRRLLSLTGMTIATFAALMLFAAAPPCPNVQDTQAACCPNDHQCIATHEREEARERYSERMHSELSFGYLGEYRNDSGRSFELDGAE